MDQRQALTLRRAPVTQRVGKGEAIARSRILKWQAVLLSLLTLGAFSWLAFPHQASHLAVSGPAAQGTQAEQGLAALWDGVTVAGDFLSQLGGFFAQAGNFDFGSAFGNPLAGTGPS
jgi:hypothetical protein